MSNWQTGQPNAGEYAEYFLPADQVDQVDTSHGYSGYYGEEPNQASAPQLTSPSSNATYQDRYSRQGRSHNYHEAQPPGPHSVQPFHTFYDPDRRARMVPVEDQDPARGLPILSPSSGGIHGVAFHRPQRNLDDSNAPRPENGSLDPLGANVSEYQWFCTGCSQPFDPDPQWDAFATGSAMCSNCTSGTGGGWASLYQQTSPAGYPPAGEVATSSRSAAATVPVTYTSSLPVSESVSPGHHTAQGSQAAETSGDKEHKGPKCFVSDCQTASIEQANSDGKKIYACQTHWRQKGKLKGLLASHPHAKYPNLNKALTKRYEELRTKRKALPSERKREQEREAKRLAAMVDRR